MTDIIVQPKRNVILDATMLSALMSCGRFFDMRNNHSLTSAKGKSNSLEVGSLIHKVFEVYYKHKVNGFNQATSVGQALTAGRLFINGCPHCANHTAEGTPSCQHEPGEYPGMQNTPEQSEGYKTGYAFALQRCEQYFEHYKNDSWTPLAVEWVKGEVIYQDDDIRILWKAKFDLTIDHEQLGIVSMDHKTFKQRRDKTTLSNQFSGHCCLLKSRNVIVNKIGLQSSLKIEDCLTREIVSYSAARIIEWQSEILPYWAYKLIEYQDSGYWPPNYTSCDSMYGPCMFKDVCEANPDMRNETLSINFIKAPTWDPRNRLIEVE